jgi:hypothetical protein
VDWVKVSDRLPTHGRVLTYSPAYEGSRDSTMLYRLMDAEFVRLNSDISHWCIPTRPVDL